MKIILEQNIWTNLGLMEYVMLKHKNINGRWKCIQYGPAFISYDYKSFGFSINNAQYGQVIEY